jgi:hypothetical protein
MRTDTVKVFLVLSAVLSLSATASTIGTCVPGALKGYVGNACSLGDRVFESFADTNDADVSRINVNFQVAATAFRTVLEALTGASFFSAQSFADRVGMQTGVAPNVPPAIYQLVGVKDQSNVSLAPGTSGQDVVANTVVPDTETGDPTPTSSIVTTSTSTGPVGTDAASLGLSSFELGSIQTTDTTVPEPASFALIGSGLLCLGLLQKRATRRGERFSLAK